MTFIVMVCFMVMFSVWLIATAFLFLKMITTKGDDGKVFYGFVGWLYWTWLPALVNFIASLAFLSAWLSG